MNNPTNLQEEGQNLQSEEILTYDDLPVCFPEPVLKNWLITNKREYKSAGITRPGLFSTHGTSTHGALVMLIVILEAAATYLTDEAGYNNIILIVSLVLLDFIIAIGFYAWTNPKLILLKNQDLVISDNKKKIQLGIEDSIKHWKRIQALGHLLILVLAGVKIYFAVTVFLGYFETSFWLIISFYVLGALLHITSTGQWFTGLWHDRRLTRANNQCKKTWGKVFGITTPRTRPVENNGVNLTQKEVGRHRLLGEANGYKFESYGYLTDDDLSELISIQISDEARRVVAIEGVKFQLQQINSLP